MLIQVFSESILEDQERQRGSTSKVVAINVVSSLTEALDYVEQAPKTRGSDYQLQESDSGSSASSFDQELLETAAGTSHAEAQHQTSPLLDDPSASHSDRSQCPGMI